MQERVGQVVDELEKACRSSLYNGGLHLVGKNGSRKRTHQENDSKSWVEIMSEAAKLSPCMSTSQHARVSHLASILLLGYLLPYSTGDGFLLGYGPTDANFNRSDREVTSTLDWSLEDRLKAVAAATSGHTGSPEDSEQMIEPRVYGSCITFLSEALSMFLESRAASSSEVDLLHLIAMIIHPKPTERFVKKTIKKLTKKSSQNSTWQKTQRLMNAEAANKFMVNYNLRLQVVKLVAQRLILPAIDNKSSKGSIPLSDGALVHLRAALHSFYQSCSSKVDGNWAQRALVSIAVQSQNDSVALQEYEGLLHRMMDDRTSYSQCSEGTCIKRTRSQLGNDETAFCAHAARGSLIQEFLVQYGELSASRNGKFLRDATRSLVDAVEFKLEQWSDKAEQKNNSEDKEEVHHSPEISAKDPPCALSSLLLAASSIWHLHLPDMYEKETDYADNQKSLFSSCIKLLQHSEPSVCHQASSLLATAFLYLPIESLKGVFNETFQSVEECIRRLLTIQSLDGKQDVSLFVDALLPIVSTLSVRSPGKAESLLELLFDEKASAMWTTQQSPAIEVGRIVPACYRAGSDATKKYASKLLDFLHGTDLVPQARANLLAALFISGGITNDHSEVRSLKSTPWTKYQLGREAMVCGDFHAANILFSEASTACSSEVSFIWLSFLMKTSLAEARLSADGASGIANTVTDLHASIRLLLSLGKRRAESCSFAITFLRLRCDFLSLMLVLHQIASETVFTGALPSPGTRMRLHTNNAIRCFVALSNRYRVFFRKSGVFLCAQSRSSMKTMRELCDAMVLASNELLGSQQILQYRPKTITSTQQQRARADHPLQRLLDDEDLVFKRPFSKAANSAERAKTLLDVMDKVLRTHVFYPRDFLSTKSIPIASLNLRFNVEASDEDEIQQIGSKVSVRVCTNEAFRLCTSGRLSEDYTSAIRLPCTTIIVSCQTTEVEMEEYTPRKDHDPWPQDEAELGKQEKTYAAVSTRLGPNGHFFANFDFPPKKQGVYVFELHLGCRDVRGNTWELELDGNNRFSLVSTGPPQEETAIQ